MKSDDKELDSFIFHNLEMNSTLKNKDKIDCVKIIQTNKQTDKRTNKQPNKQKGTND